MNVNYNVPGVGPNAVNLASFFGGSGFDSTAIRQAQAPSKSRGTRRRPATKKCPRRAGAGACGVGPR